MGEETARLREEIDRTRDDLTRDVDLLADKTSPSRIVERRVQRTRQGLGRGLAGLKEKVMGSSPGTGRHAAYGATYGPTYTDDVYGTQPAAYPTSYPQEGDEGGGRLSSAKESASEAASHAADRAREGVERARDQVSYAGQRTHEVAQDTVTGVREQTEGNPLAAGLVAFGIGWLVSSLLPASEAEQQAALRAGEAAREHGGPVLEQAKQAAQEVGQNLQGEASEAAQQIKERTQDAAGTVKEEARSSANS